MLPLEAQDRAPQASRAATLPGGVDALLPLVYEELRHLAEALLTGRPAAAVRTTSLVHDAYIRLVQVRGLQFSSRYHFLGIAAKAMRSVLVDRARRRNAAKRRPPPLQANREDVLTLAENGPDVLAVHEALGRLAQFDARKSEIVELRFFGGMTLEETAEVLGLAPVTIKREWALAKAWLFRELQG